MTTIAVCAMGKQPFDGIAAAWIDHLGALGFDVSDHRARRCTRDLVVADLHGAADIVVYIGHGRSRGWNGYQTLRMHHLEATGPTRRGPVGAVLAFACRTAGHDAEGRCFGEWLVRTGRCRAYLGWAGDLPVGAGTALSDRIVRTMAEQSPPTVGHLLELVAAEDFPAPERELLTQTVLHGDPDAPLLPSVLHHIAELV